MKYREFWLTNSKYNKELDNADGKYLLNDKTHFLNIPEGLGFQKSYSSNVFGNSEEITDELFKMVDVSGEMIFNGTTNQFTYQYYDEFIEFAKYKPLQLHYKTPNKVYGYYSDVVLTSLQKSEIGVDGLLRCAITFHRSTQWKNDNTTRLVFAKEIASDGKNYDYAYNYHYAGSNYSKMQPIVNNGTEDCSMVFEIVGGEDGITNPIFTLFQNDVPYGRIKLTGTFSYVRIDSDELDETIYLEDINGTPIANPMNTQDLASFDGETYYTWLKIKVGENIGTFTASNIDTFDGLIKLTYEEKRATV